MSTSTVYYFHCCVNLNIYGNYILLYKQITHSYTGTEVFFLPNDGFQKSNLFGINCFDHSYVMWKYITTNKNMALECTLLLRGVAGSNAVEKQACCFS